MIQDITANAIGGLITSVIVGTFVLALRFYIRWRDQLVTHRELLHDIKNKTHRPTSLMLLYTLAMLQLTWTLAIFGVVAFLIQYFGRANNDFAWIVFSTLIVTGIAIVPISIRLYHRLRKNYFWIKPFVIVLSFLAAAIEVGIITGEFPSLVLGDMVGLAALLVLTFMALLPGMYLGQYIARKTQSTFTMTQLFKHLSGSDKKELIELVDSLPSTKKS